MNVLFMIVTYFVLFVYHLAKSRVVHHHKCDQQVHVQMFKFTVL